MKKSKNLKVYARALYEATLGLSGKNLAVVIERFVALLARRGLMKQASRIIAEFERLAKEAEGIVEIEVLSSRNLSAATLSHVKRAFGDKVEAKEKVDPELLGGVVVRTRDTILDGSLRTQLNNLKMKLAS